MRRHLGLMGMAAALALLGEIGRGEPQRPMPRYRPPVKKKRQGPVNARLKKTHRLKGMRP